MLLGSTYSLFVTSDVDENLNVYQTGVLDVTYTLDEDNIVLTDTTPHTINEGKKLYPYRITITNIGTVAYKFNLILLDTTATDVIDYHYIMTSVGKLEPKRLSACNNNIIKSDIVIPAGEKANIDVRIWISDDVKNSEIGKSFYAKLSIDGIAVYNENDNIDNSVLELPYYLKYDGDTFSEQIIKLYNDGSAITTVNIGGDASKPQVHLNATQGIMLDNNGEYRYYGANPNNYVWYNDELWRIISVGNVKSSETDTVGETRVKIVKADILTDDNGLNKYSWDSSASTINSGYGVNDWSRSDLMTELNTLYFNSTSGACYTGNNDTTTVCNFTNTGLSEEARNLTADALYYLGGATSYEAKYASDYYTLEKGKNVFSCSTNDGACPRATTWAGRVGIIYQSDYAYATDLSACTVEGYYYENYTNCKGNDWLLHSTLNQWTLSPVNPDAIYAYFIYTGGCLNRYDLVGNAQGVRPVQYLKADVFSYAGTGTSSDPYKISLDMYENAATYIMSTKPTGLNTSLEGGMYRFQGTTADNYICFGTDDKNECLNNQDAYLYRIIGINSNNQVKLIKKEALNSAIRWFYGNSDISWPNSTLYSEINGSSFLTNETYVPASWSNKIATVSWKYGDLSDSAAASSIYSTENGWTNTTSAKVGLMYVHDYFYASQSGGLNCNSSSSQCKSSWIHLTNNDSGRPDAMEWTMTRHGYNSYYSTWIAWLIFNDGTINWGGSEYANSRTARPVFYLKETESIVSGNGTSDDPFIIFMEELSISADKAATYIMNSNSTGLNTSLEAGMYRYQGTLANNYICFGTRDKNDCLSNTDAHLYRIIGINSDNQVKLIKKEALNSTIKWFSSNSDISWPNSILYSEINGSSFLSNDTYVPTGWSDKIATVSWKYGDLSDSAAASSIYSTENGWTNTISAKVGLMYAHDYFYASQSGGLNCNTYYSRCKASWIHLTNNDSGRPDAMEWTMTRHGYNSYYSTWIAWLIFNDGTINWGGSEYANSRTVRPVFYLKENVFISSGSGTSTDPFIIS